MTGPMIFVLVFVLPIVVVISIGIGAVIEIHDRTDRMRRAIDKVYTLSPTATLNTEGGTAYILLDAPTKHSRLSEAEANRLIDELTKAKVQMQSVRILLDLESDTPKKDRTERLSSRIG